MLGLGPGFASWSLKSQFALAIGSGIGFDSEIEIEIEIGSGCLIETADSDC